MSTKYDYPALRVEYVTSDISIRELCKRHDIASWSSVAQWARKHNWDRDREDYKKAAFEHEINALAEKRALKLAQTFDIAIDVIQATFLRMAQNLSSADYHVSPHDLSELLTKLQLLAGGPTSREEVHGFNLSADLPPELLRAIQDAARAGGAGLKPVGQSALPLAEGARKVN